MCFTLNHSYDTYILFPWRGKKWELSHKWMKSEYIRFISNSLIILVILFQKQSSLLIFLFKLLYQESKGKKSEKQGVWNILKWSIFSNLAKDVHINIHTYTGMCTHIHTNTLTYVERYFILIIHICVSIIQNCFFSF